MKDYALYRGDEFLFLGTQKECADHLNVKPKTIYFYSSPVYLQRLEKRKTLDNSIISVCIDDIEDDLAE